MLHVAKKSGFAIPDKVTPRRLALIRQLPLQERSKAAAALVTEGRPLKLTKQIATGQCGVSLANIDKALNGSRRRRPKIAPQTLADLTDLWQEVLALSGVIKYQNATYQKERFIAFERFVAKWWLDHTDVRDLAAAGSADALHATAVRAVAAVIEAIVANYAD